MNKKIGIRREDKNKWEVRVPIIPEAVKKIKNEWGIDVVVQPFPKRAYSDDEYLLDGAEINEDLSKCKTIIAVKEIPIDLLLPEKTYMFFSHTIKGQKYNIPLLKQLIKLKSTLIDYECIKNDKGQRLVFFGRFAGLAGMIDAFHGLGQRFKALGKDTIFLKINPAYEYKDLAEAKEAIKKIGEEITKDGIDHLNKPLVFGFAGYGNVSKGAQEIFDYLPFKEIKADEIKNIPLENSNNYVYKVVFAEKDLVEPIDRDYQFDLQDYFKNPAKYKSKFENYLPALTVLINAIYWDDRYPRLVSKEFLKNIKNDLVLISDISCDIDGAIEITNNSTKPDEPAYVYNPKNDSFTMGYEGAGIVDMAVDNLPCELPRDASDAFSNALLPFIGDIAGNDFTDSFENLKLCDEIKNAIILLNGEFTPNYRYMEKYL
ncbi:MAG: bifunctional lysine ketoglutarate reductase /saccharopine dehydrogenase family protein [bacterium]